MDDNLATMANYIFIILLIAAAVYWLGKFLVARRWNQHKAATVGKWEREGIEFVRGPAGGQFGGLESDGSKRVVRGIGFVVMTETDLRVTRAQPPGIWCITYKQIKGITIQPAFMGHRAKKTPFIVVRFVKEGQKDKLGFQVNNFETWAEELAEAAGVSVRDRRN